MTQQSGAKFKTVSAARAATIAESRLQKKIAVLGDTDPKRWPALRNPLKKRLKVWDSLDPWEQEKVARYGYMPKGATQKPIPKVERVMSAPFKTVSEVRAANIAAGGCFFSRENMRHAGDTLKSFALWRDPQGELFIYRKPEAMVNTPRLQGVESSKIQVGFNHNLGTLWRVESSGRLAPVGTVAIREFYLRLKEKS